MVYAMSNIEILQNINPILELEQEILKHPQVEMPVETHYCNKMCARTLKIPAGTILTGAIHKDDCFFVVRQGQLVVTTDADPVILNVGDMTITKALTKRAGIAITDCIVTTFHNNNDNSIDDSNMFDRLSITPELLLGEDK